MSGCAIVRGDGGARPEELIGDVTAIEGAGQRPTQGCCPESESERPLLERIRFFIHRWP